jgi:phosphoribosylanthranilate isomerase
MTMVKICGITNLEDALWAVECGADMLGFNFYGKSQRYVEPNLAREIVSSVPERVLKVGVFVNMEEHRISEFVDLVGLTAVQMHGNEDRAFIDELRKNTEATLIKAMRVHKDFLANSVCEYGVDAVLLDSYSTDKYGGTGAVFDWTTATAVKELVPALYLAGGLTPENVSDAVRTVRPYAVDVASGVESSPRKKDRRKIEAFIENAKNA